MFSEVLDKKRKGLLPQLGFLKKYGFYMAGGTALALQLGHRTSLDFDFYTTRKFDSRKLREDLDQIFKKIEEVYIAEDTLVLSIEDIGVSFFKYPYPLIRSYQKINNILIASPEDIAAMKILAISQRGRRRDFIDIYFLMQKFTVNQMMGFVKEKYPMFNIYLGLQGLTYFADADQDPEKGRYRLLKKVKWNEIKKFIIGEVNRFKTRYLKK
ncbi:MAG: hypothetical protein COY73_02115 [Candidatus Nealsonbacteria bacterium CG_4_10_14_0_8_um_filter_37_14]|uniref:Nucleotidyl transferase AbiEii/AbiGii toxin family protein n=1 Tax=Candidatus Nealsonbacteria bacterium CG_4_10_14_0_8_um_filter_37_14 TaxID=1974684 RepID=A0A2M7R6R2_9BACT|nr:MAG: hypothetical protein COY73_02115 [Candidatus Nealsonbacteria bacterium CG_4_10_14_0_8_um_filter_37_14]